MATTLSGALDMAFWRLISSADPSDGGNAPSAPEGLKQLDLAQLFHHMIIGPAVYPYSMLEAFAVVLQNAGVSEPAKRILPSEIPIRM